MGEGEEGSSQQQPAAEDSSEGTKRPRESQMMTNLMTAAAMSRIREPAAQRPRFDPNRWLRPPKDGTRRTRVGEDFQIDALPAPNDSSNNDDDNDDQDQKKKGTEQAKNE